MSVECICKECGNIFHIIPSRINSAKFCSKSCKNSWRSKNYIGTNAFNYKGGGIKHTCLYCKNEFEIPKSHDHRRSNKFCSLICKNNYYNNMKIMYKCIECNSNFKLLPSEIKKSGSGKFCSKNCQSKWYSKNNIGENNRLYKKITCECDICKQPFKILPSRIKRNNGHKFCSKKCQLQWSSENSIGIKNSFFGKHHSNETKNKISISNREKLSGEKNPSYIHGERSRKYCYMFYGTNGVRIRSLIFYNYKCESCGKTNEQSLNEYKSSLEVHHVYYRKMSCCENELEYESGVRKIGDKLWIKERNGTINEHIIIGKPEKFVVLCKSCHSKTTSNNRYEWIKHYENIINTKYDGKSFITKEEYLNYNQT